MNFLNPLVLIGLAAASIPLILHLLNLRRQKNVEFSTLKFLKQLQKTKIRRIKLKQILLLILRTLLIVFLVLAFARPTIESSLPALGAYSKSSAVIIVDNSFSMDVSDERGNRFTQAKKSALSIIRALREGDEAAVIPMAESGAFESGRFTRNFNILESDIASLKLSNTRADLEQSLINAARLLDETMNINKEIFIISDGQANTFDGGLDGLEGLFGKNTAVYYAQAGAGAEATVNNLSVDSIRVITRIFQLNKLVEVEADIMNRSDKDAQGVAVSMYFNGARVAQRAVDIPAGEIKVISISAEPEDNGINRAWIEIEEDALSQDNKRFFGFVIPEPPRAAIVGSPSSSSFIQLAMKAENGSGKTADIELFPPAQFSSIDLSSFEIVICAGGPYFQTDFTRLVNFVENGGGVLIFADDETELKAFSEGLEKLGLGAARVMEFERGAPLRFSSVDRMHPLFEGVFKGATNNTSIVESPDIYKMMPNGQGQKIIETPAGAFLSESRLGEGKAIYCAVTPKGDWSNFPVTGLFPALIYRSAFYLTAREDLGHEAKAGEPFLLNLPKRFSTGGNFKVVGPLGAEFFMQAAVLPTGAALSFEGLNQFGNYAILSPQEKPVAVFSVNPEPSESNLNLYNKEEITKAISNKLELGHDIEFVDNPSNVVENIERARTGTELWQLFVILALACAIAEMIVAKNSRKDAEPEE